MFIPHPDGGTGPRTRSLVNSQKGGDLLPVKSDHHLISDEKGGRRPAANLLDKGIERFGILVDKMLFERNVML